MMKHKKRPHIPGFKWPNATHASRTLSLGSWSCTCHAEVTSNKTTTGSSSCWSETCCSESNQGVTSKNHLQSQLTDPHCHIPISWCLATRVEHHLRILEPRRSDMMKQKIIYLVVWYATSIPPWFDIAKWNNHLTSTTHFPHVATCQPPRPAPHAVAIRAGRVVERSPATWVGHGGINGSWLP